MLHESFTSISRAEDGRLEFKLERLGRAVLGIWCWRFMSSLAGTMLPPESEAWGRFLRCGVAGVVETYSRAWAEALRSESAAKAIRAYAESRRARGEDVDVDAALGAFKKAAKMGGGPWN